MSVLSNLGALEAIAAMILAGLIVSNLVLFLMAMRSKKRYRLLRDAILEIKDDNKVLYQTDSRMGEVIGRLTQNLDLLKEDVNQLLEKKVSHEVYENAMRLVTSGSDIDTVVEKSGLTKGEVELLLSLKQGGHSGGPGHNTRGH